MHDPAALIRLPAMAATPIERVASPSQFARVLAALAMTSSPTARTVATLK